MELHQHQTLPAQIPPVLGSHNFSPNPLANLYERDIYAWAMTNARLLQERKFDELDLTNLIDEVQDMAKSEQRSIFSHLVNLLMHLLKWQFQPTNRSNSWRASIRNARYEIKRLVKDSPSLHSIPERRLSEGYQDSRQVAADETGISLKNFPIECPFTVQQLLDEDWLPA